MHVASGYTRHSSNISCVDEDDRTAERWYFFSLSFFEMDDKKKSFSLLNVRRRRRRRSLDLSRFSLCICQKRIWSNFYLLSSTIAEIFRGVIKETRQGQYSSRRRRIYDRNKKKRKKISIMNIWQWILKKNRSLKTRYEDCWSRKIDNGMIAWEFILSFKGKDGGVASEATTNSGSNKQPNQTDDDDDEEEDEPVYIESSPCSRWQKRRETVGVLVFSFDFLELVCSFFLSVAQRDIPGMDASYLAMDTEEGVEVVWNEVLFSERKISESPHVSWRRILSIERIFLLFFS